MGGGRGPDRYSVWADLHEEGWGSFTLEVLQMQCIHGDTHEYRTKVVTIGIGSETFTCQVGVIPQLDCGLLIERDCAILAKFLRRMPTGPGVPQDMVLQAEDVGVELPIQQPDLAQLSCEDPFLWCALANVGRQTPRH